MVKAIHELKEKNQKDWENFPRGRGSLTAGYTWTIMAKNNAYNEALSIIAKFRDVKPSE